MRIFSDSEVHHPRQPRSTDLVLNLKKDGGLHSPGALLAENRDDSFFQSFDDEKYYGSKDEFGKHKNFDKNRKNFHKTANSSSASLGDSQATTQPSLRRDDDSEFIRGGRSRMSMATVVRQIKGEQDKAQAYSSRDELIRAIGLADISPLRKKMLVVLMTNKWIERAILALILANCVSSAATDPKDFKVTTDRNIILRNLETGFTIVFAAEALVRGTLQGLTRFEFSYLRDKWNVFDFVIVLISTTTLLIETISGGNASGITILRTFRILRPLKAITRLRGLQLIITVLLRSLKSLVDVLLLCLFFLLVAGIVGVQLWSGQLASRCVPNDVIHEVYNESRDVDFWFSLRESARVCTTASEFGFRCAYGETCMDVGNPSFGYISFDNMGWATLTLFTVVTLEGWSSVMYYAMDASSGFTAIYFVLVVLCGSFFIANLVLVTINTVFFSARAEEDEEEEAEESDAGTFLSSHPSQDEQMTPIKTPVTPAFGLTSSLRSASERVVCQSHATSSSSDMNNHPHHTNPLTNRPSGIHVTSPIPGLAPLEVPLATTPSKANGNRTQDLPESIAAFTESMLETTFSSNAACGLHTPAPVAHALEPAGSWEEESMNGPGGVLSIKGVLNSRSRMSDATPSSDGTEADAEEKGEVEEDRKGVKEKLHVVVENRWFANVILVTILSNTLILASEHHNQPDAFTVFSLYSNYVFTTVFLVESVLKMYVYRWGFVDDKVNVFDAVVSVLSVVDVAVELVQRDQSGGSGISVFRAFRLMRVFKLAKQFPDLWRTFAALLESLEGVSVLTLLLSLVIFVYALLGMSLFGGRMCDVPKEGFNPERGDICYEVPRYNFDELSWAMITVFQVITGEDWTVVMYAGMRSRDSAVFALYFVSLFIIGNYIVLSLFVAVLINNTQFAPEAEQQVLDASKTAAEQSGTRSSAAVLNLALQQKLARQTQADGNNEANDNPDDPSLIISQPTLWRVRIYLLFHMGREPEDERTIALKQYITFLEKERENEVIAAFGNSASGCRSPFASFKKKKKGADTIGRLNVATTAAVGMLPELEEQIVHLGWDKVTKLFPVSASESVAVLLRITKEMEAVVCIVRYRSLFCMASMNPVRRQFARLVETDTFEVIVIIFIVVSTVSLALYNPIAAPDTLLPYVLGWIDLVLTCCFSAEALLKTMAYGFLLHPSAYLRRDGWNVLDFIIVVLSIVSVGVPGAESVGMLRMIRTLRPLRFINRSTGMKLVLDSLISSLYPLLHIGIVIGLIFVIFAILGVHLFKGTFYACTLKEWGDATFEDPFIVEEQHCTAPYRWVNQGSHFDNVGSALVSLFEMSTLEGWVTLMYSGIDATSPGKAPVKNNSLFAALYFIVWVVIGAFFIVNLFIGVLIDHYDYARAKHDKESVMGLSEEQKMWLAIQDVMYRSTVSRVKLGGRSQNAISKICQNLVLTKHFEQFWAMVIIFNTVLAATEYHGQPASYGVFLENANIAFVALFTLELTIRIVADGRSFFYESWNRFDFCIVIISVIGLLLSVFLNTASSVVSIFRVLRLLRLTRIIKSTQEVRNLLRTLWLSLPNLGNVAGLLSLLYFLYAIVGMNLFGNVISGSCIGARANFFTFGNSFLLLFRLSTGEEWQCFMNDYRATAPDCSEHLNTCGHPELSPLYFISFTLVVMYVLLNILIAVILGGYDTVQEELDQPVLPSDLEAFFEHYDASKRALDTTLDSSIDKNETLVNPHDSLYWSLRTIELPALLQRIGPPLGYEKQTGAEDVRLRNMKKTSIIGIILCEINGRVSLVDLLATLSHAVKIPRYMHDLIDIMDEDFLGEILPHEGLRSGSKWQSTCRLMESRWEGVDLCSIEDAGTPRHSPRVNMMTDAWVGENTRRQVLLTFSALKIQQIWRGKKVRLKFARINAGAEGQERRSEEEESAVASPMQRRRSSIGSNSAKDTV